MNRLLRTIGTTLLLAIGIYIGLILFLICMFRSPYFGEESFVDLGDGFIYIYTDGYQIAYSDNKKVTSVGSIVLLLVEVSDYAYDEGYIFLKAKDTMNYNAKEMYYVINKKAFKNNTGEQAIITFEDSVSFNKTKQLINDSPLIDMRRIVDQRREEDKQWWRLIK